MDIAYLILAHNQPGLLIREVERLTGDNVYFFIHVDKKSKDNFDYLTRHFAGCPNVKVVSVVPIFWMGFNMVRATILLLRMAASAGKDIKYYVLLSGQDYPIKSNHYINDFFDRHSCDFISYNALAYMPESFRNKVAYYHFMDNARYNPRSPSKSPMLVKLYYGLHRRIDKYLPKRKFYKGYTPFFGSQWFALTAGTVQYIFDFLEKNRGYPAFMKYAEGPDEIFFQTIIMNSDRGTNVYDYNRYMEWLKTRKDGEIFVHEYSSLRFMDWSEQLLVKPATLDMSYYDTLAVSKELFARKVDEKKSAELLDKIDTNLLK